jgi:hypothetical protein
LLSAKGLRTGFWSVFDVEIGGKLCRRMVLSPTHIYRHSGGFSQLQLQQQEVLFFVLIRLSQNNLSLVVMMTAVNLWKARQAQQPQFLATPVHCAPECAYLGNFSTPEHGTHSLRLSILALQQNFPSLLKRFAQRAVRLDLPYRVVATNVFRHFSGFASSKP